MFDPTAFENMKVVIEGTLYDLDLSGEIRILDRNDLLNSAKISRKYEISFTDQMEGQADIYCSFLMEASLANLAAELLPAARSSMLAGCHIYVKFYLKHPNELSLFQKIERILIDIWGKDRTIKQVVMRDPFDDGKIISNETTVIFNRLVLEDQIDDLVSMIDYLMVSLKSLRSSIR
ncbi:hypothetical protein BGM26_08235 [Bacillus sp. FJAT-29790]|uniref:hypothetical protein n=1 Tax=Bacillus sp. FJAT-29790 TaxID=1895002 RepID=UPI001C222512|nr:hypothetical protein [Bacillus sp. FJAT-29790]MBU8878973.1 hypothetical protein [Bacillus sp. FJAT-29790]